jgi:acyl carrier protein
LPPTPGAHNVVVEHVSPPSVDAIAAGLRRQIAQQSKGRLRAEDVDPELHFCEHGYLDSLSYVEFLLHVEATWGVRVGDAQFIGALNTVRALAAHVAAACSGAAA